MKAVEFEGQTVVLRPPEGWDNNGETPQCGGLPIQAIEDRGMPVLRSFWRPSPADIEMLKNGAHVCLGIVGTSHPPVMVYVEKCEELP